MLNSDSKTDMKTGVQDTPNKKNSSRQTVNSGQGKFEGRCEDLKGHVYDHGNSKVADQFILTTKELKNYVGRTYKHGGDMTEAIENLMVPTKTEPSDPNDPDDRIAMKKWEREYDEYRKWSIVTHDNLKALYQLVWGQCSDAMQQKIESLPTFATITDGITLLIAIQDSAYNYQSQKYIFQSVSEALYRLMTLRQNNLTPAQYYEQFTNCLAVYILLDK